MSAASSVHQSRTMRQHREQTGIENRMCVRGKRKQANENVAARKELGERCLTGVAGNPVDDARRTAPAGHRKAKTRQLAGCSLADLPQTADADAGGCCP